MNALTIRNLTKTYANGNQALKGIDLTVEAGEFYALIGPNGAGKTTAIGIISSLVNKSGGEVEIFGHNLDRELEAAKACLGIVPQEINLNLWETVRNTVTHQAGYYGLSGKLRKERVEKYLRELRLWDRRDDIARSLSGGMKRRLMIARALVHEPKLLILDEPTAGLDPIGAAAFDEQTRQLQQTLGLTVFLITHDLDTLYSICGRVAVLADKKVIAVGTIDELLATDHPWIQEYFNGPRGRAATAAVTRQHDREQDRVAQTSPDGRQ